LGIGGGVVNPGRLGLPNFSCRFISLVMGAVEFRGLEKPDDNGDADEFEGWGVGETNELPPPETDRLFDREFTGFPKDS
jgi:hypothetical protein